MPVPQIGPRVSARDHALGSADAPVTLVEYGDDAARAGGRP
jgi:hypothetical protein